MQMSTVKDESEFLKVLFTCLLSLNVFESCTLSKVMLFNLLILIDSHIFLEVNVVNFTAE